MRCIICGKEYARKVTDAHLKSHGVSKKAYAKKEAALSPELWEFYWTHPGVRKNWPDPVATLPSKGMKYTFATYMAVTGADRL